MKWNEYWWFWNFKRPRSAVWCVRLHMRTQPIVVLTSRLLLWLIGWLLSDYIQHPALRVRSLDKQYWTEGIQTRTERINYGKGFLVKLPSIEHPMSRTGYYISLCYEYFLLFSLLPHSDLDPLTSKYAKTKENNPLIIKLHHVKSWRTRRWPGTISCSGTACDPSLPFQTTQPGIMPKKQKNRCTPMGFFNSFCSLNLAYGVWKDSFSTPTLFLSLSLYIKNIFQINPNTFKSKFLNNLSSMNES